MLHSLNWKSVLIGAAAGYFLIPRVQGFVASKAAKK